MQTSETLRNSLGVNYKSAALSGGVAEQNAATLYFSVAGAVPIPPLLPSIALLHLLTFWPVCKESLIEIRRGPEIHRVRVQEFVQG